MNKPTSEEFTTGGKFDINKFNNSFETTKEQKKLINKEHDNELLQKLNNNVDNKPLYKNTMSEIIIGIKNSWFYLLDDLIEQKFSIDTFTKDNRLFYIGITLIIIAIILYFYNVFTTDDDDIATSKNDSKIIEKYYFIQNDAKGMKTDKITKNTTGSK